MTTASQNSKPIRLAIAGLGMGGAHARAAIMNPAIELVALADPDLGRFKSVCESLDAARAKAKLAPVSADIRHFTDYRTMIEAGDVDAVVIALATHLHAEASIFALEHGLAVLCEKPPTTRTDEMIPVARLAREKGLVYLFGRQQRFRPVNQKIRSLVDAGKLGRVYLAHSAWYRTGWIPFRKGYGMNKATGGGALLDLGIHQIDDAWFAMGCPQPVSVTCEMQCNFSHLRDNEVLEVPYDADDTTIGLIRFENGAVLSFTVTFAMNSAGPGHAPIEKEGRTHWVELSVFGTEAGVEAHHNRMAVRKSNSLDVEVRELHTGDSDFINDIYAQMDHFAACVRGETPPLNNAEQAIMLMQMLDACRESAETGRSVQLTRVESMIS